MLALLVILGLILPPLPAQVPQTRTTSVHIQVFGAYDQPIAALRLTLRDDARSLMIQTDATGAANASGLVGAFLRVTDAVMADGTRLRLDPTTLRDGLRFGLIPGQDRTVILRLDNGLIFVDPETIFAGTAAEPTPTGVPSAGASVSVRTAAQVSDPSGATGASGGVLLVMLGILALPALGAACWWLWRVRMYWRSRR